MDHEGQEQDQKQSEANQRTLRKHFLTHGKFAKSAEKIQRAIDRLIDDEADKETPDLWRLEKLAVTLTHAEKVCGKSIEGQRAAASLDLEDIQKAYLRLKRAGYEAVPEHQYNELIKLLPEQEPPEPEGGWINVEVYDPEPTP